MSRVARPGWLLLVLGAAAVAASTAATWFSAPVTSVMLDGVSATGGAAAPAVAPLLLVVAAASLARLLARGALARVIAWLTALVSLGVVVAVGAALANARDVLARSAGEVTGVSAVGGPIVTTAWGVVALVAALVLLAGAVLLAIAPERTAQRPARAARYERPGEKREGEVRARAATPSSISDWDSLSRGEDPSRVVESSEDSGTSPAQHREDHSGSA